MQGSAHGQIPGQAGNTIKGPTLASEMQSMSEEVSRLQDVITRLTEIASAIMGPSTREQKEVPDYLSSVTLMGRARDQRSKLARYVSECEIIISEIEAGID